MKSILLSISFLLLFACNQTSEKEAVLPEINIQKETCDFKVGFEPENSILFENHLILSGENKVIAIDLNLNRVDTAFSNKIFIPGISKMIFRNDTILSYFKKNDTWKFWNGKWNDYNLSDEWFFIDKTEWDVIKYLYKDSSYVVFGLDLGEFGGAINFYNKKTSRLYAKNLSSPNFCIKDGNRYVINGSLPHMNGSVEVVIVDNPDKLIYVPDSLNIYLNDSVGNYFDFVEAGERAFLPDTLVRKITDGRFDFDSYRLSKKIINKKLQITSVIDTSGMLCYATFPINKRLVHFIDDTTLYAGTVFNDSLYNVDTLYNEHFFTYYYSGQSFHDSRLMAFNYWKRKYKKEKMIYLIWYGGKLKRYNVY